MYRFMDKHFLGVGHLTKVLRYPETTLAGRTDSARMFHSIGAYIPPS
jgi:hypothetical protein